jgi:heterodisulfide reductase subunit B
MPVLHLAQLLGAAAGIREDELKFKRHVVRLPAKTRRKLLQTDEAPAEAATTA